jgi:hypothetical protein
MKPHSGPWAGTFVIPRVTTLQISVDLEFADTGAITGQFQVHPSYPETSLSYWNGPASGKISTGAYSPFGSIYFAMAPDVTHGGASFNGRFEVAAHDVGVIWGSVFNTYDQQIGIMTVTFAGVPGRRPPEHPSPAGGGVWGH